LFVFEEVREMAVELPIYATDMSKRALKKYLSELQGEEVREQLLDLYDRFPEVKEYYNFVFHPQEDKMLQEAKAKISNEYFPLRRKRPKARRSVAQKFIKQFLKLGVAPYHTSDLMLYNLEVAQSFSLNRNLPDAFYKSMLNSYDEMVTFTALNGLLPEFLERIQKYHHQLEAKNWPLLEGFSRVLDQLDENGKP
tara:strand:+ start:46069 stop:46653 length:585 start_codon:yes stop_codon:yes gene_type:complete